METYKSIIAYDGTDFQGFQRQKPGLRTVQAVLEDALRSLDWNEPSIKAAGRTDAGVHARGQVIAFRLAWKHGAASLVQALNANLPSDVAVLHTESVSSDFHPRHSAQRRRYRYSLIVAPVRDPLRERYAWRIWPEPNLEAMQAVADILQGRHDFAAFGRAPIPEGHTMRQVFHSVWQRGEEGISFEIEADAFLYRMVRRLVAAMLEVGAGHTGLENVQNLLDQSSLRWEGSIAEARGLCLEAVIYE
ncbi:MAG: tRNA pseudouridine(38-40) synthase TruA [Anaerolineales bacterium]|nr:tRNA pseudouridine(38-40) synthase TruA [Anaerolineales bacterium]